MATHWRRRFPSSSFMTGSASHMIASGWSCAHASGSAIRSCWLSWPKWSRIQDPLPQTEIARRTALSTRQLERLFRKYLNTTPTRYYLNLRIARTRQLLRQTSMSILSVALACGFVSASHFSKCYRETYGRTPLPNGPWINPLGLILRGWPLGGSALGEGLKSL